MTNREELIEKMARAMCKSEGYEPDAPTGPDGSMMWHADKDAAAAALTALETHFATKGWKITWPEPGDGMIEAADGVTSGERSGLSAFGIDYWSAIQPLPLIFSRRTPMASERTCGNCKWLDYLDGKSSWWPQHGSCDIPIPKWAEGRDNIVDTDTVTNCQTWAEKETPDAQ
jgi:hypothetical protein